MNCVYVCVCGRRGFLVPLVVEYCVFSFSSCMNGFDFVSYAYHAHIIAVISTLYGRPIGKVLDSIDRLAGEGS